MKNSTFWSTAGLPVASTRTHFLIVRRRNGPKNVIVWRGTGGGRLGERGRCTEGGRKGGGKGGFPGWREAGEIRKNYAALHNILQLTL